MISSNIKIDIIIYGDFNAKILKYKAYGARAYIEILREKGMLGAIICRETTATKNSREFISAIPFGALIPKILTLIQEKTGWNLRNFSQNTLFDFFASKKIISKNVLSFSQGLRRCLRKVHDKGGIYIEVSTTENMEEYLVKLIKENKKFNLPVKNNLKKILLNGIRTAKLADYLIVISENAKNTYIRKGFNENKIFVVEQGIELLKEQPKNKYEKNNELKLSCLAHFQILKGVHYLVKAVKEMGNHDIQLDLIGDIDRNSKLAINTFSGNINNIKNVNIIGKVLDPNYFLKKSDVFISPSLSEGFGRAIAEAMAMGVPVIITKNCGVDIRDGIDGFIVDSANVEQLKEKIKYFFENRSKLEEMGKNARKRIEEICSEEKRKSKIRNFFDSILIN